MNPPRRHDSHSPKHGVSQQVPLAQLPLEHCGPDDARGAVQLLADTKAARAHVAGGVS